MKRRLLVTLLTAATLLATPLLWAQLPKPEEIVDVRLEPGHLKARPGGHADFTVVARIREGFHTNSHKPSLDYLIPTRIELLGDAPFTLEKADYPAGELKTFGFAPDEKLSIYEGTVKIPVRLRAQTDAPAGTHTLRLAFHFQACNDQLCLRPAQREVKLTVSLQ